MQINQSNLAHAGLAVGAQLVLAVIFALLAPWSFTACLSVGAAFSIGFYYGREVDQVEKNHNRTPWWIGFKWSLWGEDARMDFICPTVAVLAVIALWSAGVWLLG